MYHDQAAAWYRLSIGKGTKSDIKFLRHELSEMLIQKEGGLEKLGKEMGKIPKETQFDAHAAVEEVFDCTEDQ